MRFTRAAFCAAGALALACTDHSTTSPAAESAAANTATARITARPLAAATDNAVFSDGFESGTLAAWQDGFNPTLHRVLSNAALSHSGTHLLEMIYPAGQGGGWLTRFFMPGYDSLYASYWLRLPSNWSGPTALLTLRGSRTDNQWSAFGKARVCPSGSDFFATGVVAGAPTSPLDLSFSTYSPGMSSCVGQSRGEGTTTYAASRRLTKGIWHQVAMWVKLNTVGQSDGLQRIWLDGQLVAEWSGLTFRTSDALTLNSLMLDGAATAPQTQHLYIDDVQLLPAMPGSTPPSPPPQTAPVAAVSVTLGATSVFVGQTTQATARLTDSTGNVLTGRKVAWSSSNTAIAIVDSSGSVKPVSPGSATITATSEGITGSALLTVANAPVATVSVVLNASGLTIGQSTQAVATLRDASGNVLTGRAISWSSSNAGVATVNGTGVVLAAGAGSATITATSEGERGSATLSVSAPTPSADTLFVDHFETGTLGDAGRWQDIVNTGASIASAATEGISAPSGSKVLKLSGNGAAITHFVSTGATSPYEHLYLSFKMLRTAAYDAANPGLRAGGIRGSTTQWGSFGVGWGTPGSCPDDPKNVNQQEFMFAYVFEDQAGWVLRTYTNWLGQQKLTTNPPTCGGGYAMGAGNTPPATYLDPNYSPSVGAWHTYEMEVQLNALGQANGWQQIWVDGVLKIRHLNVTYRTTNGMKLWAVTFDTGTLHGGQLYVDDVVVASKRP